MKNNKIKFMSKVSEEIIGLQIKDSDTFKSVKQKFYKIMRKYFIKKGMKFGNGTLENNFEWTMCFNLFITRVKDKLELDDVFNRKIPKDLRRYL